MSKNSDGIQPVEMLLAAMVLAVIGYVGACAVTTISHIFNMGEPTPFLATLPALLLAVVVIAVVLAMLVWRLAVVYGQCSNEEKSFLHRVALAIFRKVKQSNGQWGKNARAAEEFYQEVKSKNE